MFVRHTSVNDLLTNRRRLNNLLVSPSNGNVDTETAGTPAAIYSPSVSHVQPRLGGGDGGSLGLKATVTLIQIWISTRIKSADS